MIWWNNAMHIILGLDRYTFWLWPILFVTQMIRAIHYFPQRKEDPWKYRIPVMLAAVSLLIMSMVPFATAMVFYPPAG